MIAIMSAKQRKKNVRVILRLGLSSPAHPARQPLGSNPEGFCVYAAFGVRSLCLFWVLVPERCTRWRSVLGAPVKPDRLRVIYGITDVLIECRSGKQTQ